MKKLVLKKYSPKGSRTHQSLTSRSLDSLKISAFLAITIWIAYFWHHSKFGLYLDDFWRVGDAMAVTGSEFLTQILNPFLEIHGGAGHPIHDFLLYLFSYIGLKLGGLQGVYWIGYVLLVVNSFLFYALLRRLSDQPFFALIGALSFCLFSAHTTQLWMTMTLGAQPSLMFLLLAIHCYLSRRRILSYLLILGSLLCYETFFPIFLAVPLLRDKWDSSLIRKLLKHTFVLFTILAFVVVIRKLSGESRVANLNILTAIKTSFRHMFVGPYISIKTFFLRPLETLQALVGIGRDFNPELWLFLPLVFLGLLWALSYFKIAKTSANTRGIDLENSEIFKSLIKLALIGFIMLVLAYPLALSLNPSVVNGAASRVHLASVVGASILCACVCSAVLLLASNYRKQHIATIGLAAFFSLQVGFGLCVQRDYQLAWQYSRAFWSDAINLIPKDIDRTSVLFFDSTGLRNPKYVGSTGGLHQTSVLNTIFQFPDDWKEESPYGHRLRPMWLNAFLLRQNWREKIVTDGDSFVLDNSVVGGIKNREGYRVKSSDVIPIEIKDRKLTRRVGPIEIGGQEFRLNETSASGPPPFEKGPLYDYLIRSPDEEPINYFE